MFLSKTLRRISKSVGFNAPTTAPAEDVVSRNTPAIHALKDVVDIKVRDRRMHRRYVNQDVQSTSGLISNNQAVAESAYEVEDVPCYTIDICEDQVKEIVSLKLRSEMYEDSYEKLKSIMDNDDDVF